MGSEATVHAAEREREVSGVAPIPPTARSASRPTVDQFVTDWCLDDSTDRPVRQPA